jgi:hypothetical protein
MPASIPSITVLLPRELKRWLERRAESEGTKVGPYVRRLIEADRTRVEEAVNAAPTERS